MLIKKVEKTQSNSDFKTINIGKAQFIKPGNYYLWIRPKQMLSGDPLMRLKEVPIRGVGG